ncbi:MAG: hypothetical protein J5965_03705 [Aeriscardovia sp.]|nr:hypothetical protein [Aeriscardovia sp.]
MARTPITTANTIARAMNQLYKTHIVINTSQFYGGEGKLVRMYVVKDSFYYKGEYSDKQIFKSASGVYTCLFMRDLLYAFQNKEIPEENNEGYNRVREKNNADANIEYMKGVYLNAETINEGEGSTD